MVHCILIEQLTNHRIFCQHFLKLIFVECRLKVRGSAGAAGTVISKIEHPLPSPNVIGWKRQTHIKENVVKAMIGEDKEP